MFRCKQSETDTANHRPQNQGFTLLHGLMWIKKWWLYLSLCKFLKLVLTMFIQYILIMLFIFLQVLPEPLHLLTQTTLWSFLSLKIKQTKKIKQKPKRYTNRDKTKQFLERQQKYQTKRMTGKQTKNHGLHFMLVTYSWAWGLLWSVVDRTSVTPLEKTNVPLSTDIHCKHS